MLIRYNLYHPTDPYTLRFIAVDVIRLRIFCILLAADLQQPHKFKGGSITKVMFSNSISGLK